MSAQPTVYRGYDREELVIGEGVAIELPVASLPSRIGSRLLDLLVTAVVMIGLVTVAGLLSFNYSGAVQRTVGLLAFVTVFVIAPTVLETWTRGKSVGKYALGLRTVRDDGGPITARQSLVRSLVAVPEFLMFLGGPALISALVSSRAKRLGDLAAGTYVISERHSIKLPPPPVSHPMLDAWAQQADLAPLPTGLALANRQFIARAARMTPAARAQLGRDLLAQTLGFVAPPPPPGWHQEYVLAAILTERRRRDTARLARDEALRRRILPTDLEEP